ncbi:hypothetical protein CYMTET_56357 [Cymbomonas tetramitiformis]|uniref:Uncharacterized protein n=1 Tax=Cymbomonas tetramitiformis TaxID=36881 RepID=A0AAE0BBG0_9CHLO|nr:hypothetical protein CYMTET_56357 [Cymbomonas tetramitiformis]
MALVSKTIFVLLLSYFVWEEFADAEAWELTLFWIGTIIMICGVAIPMDHRLRRHMRQHRHRQMMFGKQPSDESHSNKSDLMLSEIDPMLHSVSHESATSMRAIQ